MVVNLYNWYIVRITDNFLKNKIKNKKLNSRKLKIKLNFISTLLIIINLPVVKSHNYI